MALLFPLHVYLLGTATVRLEDGGTKKSPFLPQPHKSLKWHISYSITIIIIVVAEL